MRRRSTRSPSTYARASAAARRRSRRMSSCGLALQGSTGIALVMRFARARGTGLSVHVAERRFRRIGVWDARIGPRVVAISPLGSPHDMAKIGTAWPTQYDHATGIAATVGGYNGFDSDGLVRLR